MSAGFFEPRAPLPQLPDQMQLVDMAEWNRQHQVNKLDDDRNLNFLDKLRRKAQRGELW